MTTKIIGFAGKKQSGKNTACNYILAKQLYKAGVCREVCLNEFGHILVSDIYGQKHPEHDFVPLLSDFINTDALLREFSQCKIYALADPLKRIAIDVLGLPEDKVYGTDDDKMELTALRWEDMPGVMTEEFQQSCIDWSYYTSNFSTNEPKSGPMTIREVLQYLGTEIFRKMHQTVWVETLLRRIEKEKPAIALVCDVRFENEITLLKDAGASIIGLTRDKFKSQDSHASEQVSLDLCHTVIDNQDLSLEDQNCEIDRVLRELGCNHITELGA